MSDVQLGRTLGPSAQRDAVHFAIAPVAAGEDLKPGTHVGLSVTGQAISPTDSVNPSGIIKLIGIVDPFLTHPVQKGKRFYVILYPNTVIGMRHHWVHPAFIDSNQKELSEKWLRAFIEDADCPDYNTVIAAATDQPVANHDPKHYSESYSNDGECLHFNGRNAHGDIPAEFWFHIEVVTGVKIEPWKRATQWSCSC